MEVNGYDERRGKSRWRQQEMRIIVVILVVILANAVFINDGSSNYSSKCCLG